jgi:hypothetical protein
MDEKNTNVKAKIDQIETTTDCLTGRAGLTLISRYISQIKIVPMLANIFSFAKRSLKGASLQTIFHQLICFFFDGTNSHLNYFDKLKTDEGYAASIETPVAEMVSSHTIKRFMQSISMVRVWLFRKVLQRLFLWRLQKEQPELIKIGLDTMVMDNDEALKRVGVEPTYKKVKGFQPLQMYWGRYIIDAIFRNGKAHSNYGNHVAYMVRNIVKLIRKHYRTDIPIILLADTGFFDESLFKVYEELKIGFVVGGKMYNDIKECIINLEDDRFLEYTRNGQTWLYCEFLDRRKSWDTTWRTIYTKPITEDTGQILLEFARPETIIYTNIGMQNSITQDILEAKCTKETTISPQAIITLYHLRGRDELANRGLKDFGVEQLPFKQFAPNAAYYYLMLISFFLFESFKYDIDSELIPLCWYATTFRRNYLDIAGKIIKTGRQLILKIAITVYKNLGFDRLWEKSIIAEPIL